MSFLEESLPDVEASGNRYRPVLYLCIVLGGEPSQQSERSISPAKRPGGGGGVVSGYMSCRPPKLFCAVQRAGLLRFRLVPCGDLCRAISNLSRAGSAQKP